MDGNIVPTSVIPTGDYKFSLHLKEKNETFLFFHIYGQVTNTLLSYW